MWEHYRQSVAEGISDLPDTGRLPFGDEEFDCMTLEEWVERLSGVVEML